MFHQYHISKSHLWQQLLCYIIITVALLFEELYRKSCQQAEKSDQAIIRLKNAKTPFSQR